MLFTAGIYFVSYLQPNTSEPKTNTGFNFDFNTIQMWLNLQSIVLKKTGFFN